MKISRKVSWIYNFLCIKIYRNLEYFCSEVKFIFLIVLCFLSIVKYSSTGNFINTQIGENPSCDSFFEQNEKCDNSRNFSRWFTCFQYNEEKLSKLQSVTKIFVYFTKLINCIIKTNNNLNKILWVYRL